MGRSDSVGSFAHYLLERRLIRDGKAQIRMAVLAPDGRFAYLFIAIRTALQIGLQRDCSRITDCLLYHVVAKVVSRNNCLLSRHFALNLFNRSELPTTSTDEKAIAPAANIGLSLPIAASGMPTML